MDLSTKRHPGVSGSVTTRRSSRFFFRFAAQPDRLKSWKESRGTPHSVKLNPQVQLLLQLRHSSISGNNTPGHTEILLLQRQVGAVVGITSLQGPGMTLQHVLNFLPEPLLLVAIILVTA